MAPTGADRPARLILDTSAYSWLRAGHDEVLDLVAAADVVWMPTVVLGELEAGFQLGRRPRENLEALDEFLAEPFVAVVPVTRDVSRWYGQVYAALRRAGTPIPINDVWIAAATLERGGCLLTFDGHFREVAGLDQMILTTEHR